MVVTEKILSLWELSVTCLENGDIFPPRPVWAEAGKRRVGSLGDRGSVGKALGERETLRCLCGKGRKGSLNGNSAKRTGATDWHGRGEARSEGAQT